MRLTFWTTRTLNFGQGALMMLRAMLVVWLIAQGAPLPVAVPGALAVTGGLGMFIERYTVRPALRGRGSMGWVVATLGFGIFLQGMAAKWFGSQAVAFPDILFSAQDCVSVFGQFVSLQYLVVLLVAVGLIAEQMAAVALKVSDRGVALRRGRVALAGSSAELLADGLAATYL